MNIFFALLIFPVLVVIISFVLSFFNRSPARQSKDNSSGKQLLKKAKKKEKHTDVSKRRKVYLLFPGHLALGLISFLVSLNWFVTGQEFFFNYGVIWMVVERGTLEALTSVMSVVGVGSILLGWIFSERDKTTLGKSQVEMIHYLYGTGYAGSIVTHFSATALSLLMLKCAAREAALWAFLTVAWGCFPQALICIRIAMNRSNREDLALLLWEQEGLVSGNKTNVICDMAQHLSDASVRRNTRYCDVIGKIINCYISESCSTQQNNSISNDIIRQTSLVFNDLNSQIPKNDRSAFEEIILASTCKFIATEEDSTKMDMVLSVMCSGYLRYIYTLTEVKNNDYLVGKIRYLRNSHELHKKCGDKIQMLLCAFEWYLFLTQQASIPQNTTYTHMYIAHMPVIFESLINSIFEQEKGHENTARIAWNQVCTGGETA